MTRDCVLALASLRRARAGTWIWAGIYLCAGLLIIEGAFAALWLHRQQVGDALLWYLVPESLHDAVRDLADRLFAEKMRFILANAGLGLGLAVAGLLLFPLKEKVSAVFEGEALSGLGPGRELSLWRQFLQEIQLFLFYTAVQLVAVWLGLQGLASLGMVASVLGWWYLIVAMAIDHAAPVLQRRGWTFAAIIPSLVRHLPLSLHLLGGLFAVPGILAALLLKPWLAAQPLLVPLAVLGVQLVGMAGATLAGTALGARLLLPPPLRQVQLGRRGLGLAWAVILLVLLWQGLFFGWLLRALHQHSQVLKCHYEVAWSSLQPRFRTDPDDPLTAVVLLDADLTVHNPTPFDLHLRDAVLVVGHEQGELARSRLDPVAVAAGATAPIHARLEAVIDTRKLAAALKNYQSLCVALELQPPLSAPLRIPLRR